MMCMFKKVTALAVALFIGMSISVNAEVVTLSDLKISLPDSVKLVSPSKDFVMMASDNKNLSLYVVSIPLSGKDESKISEKGDFIYFPFLKQTQQTGDESENWSDWTHKYRKHTYEITNENGELQKVYTYHINSKKHRFIFLMLPSTEQGDKMANELIESGISNGSWFANAPAWWIVTFIILFCAMLFVIEEDEGYDFSRHLKAALIALAIFAALALFTMRYDMSFFWSAMLVAFIIVALTPPLRKPIIWIAEHTEA